MIKKLLKTNEFVVFLILVGLSVVIQLINPAFFTISTLFDTLRGATVYYILAFALLPIIIAGGVDMSFVAMAAVSTYIAHMLLISMGYQGGIWIYFVISCFIGGLMGLFNGFLVTKFKLPIFSVSLATFTMWYGFALFFIGSTMNFNLPQGAVGYYESYLVSVKDPVLGNTGLHSSIIFVILAGLFIWWFLKYTTIGRGVFAIGGNRDVAERSGYNVKKIMLIIFVIMGVLSAVAGVLYGLLNRFFGPTVLQGNALDVIAAIILGGASINGGKGSVIGTVLGVTLIQVINRALILCGIPAEWQKLVVGLILVIFISLPALRARRENKIGHTTAMTELE
jgi:simple sugar transport system permease protein